MSLFVLPSAAFNVQLDARRFFKSLFLELRDLSVSSQHRDFLQNSANIYSAEDFTTVLISVEDLRHPSLANIAECSFNLYRKFC